MVRRWLAFVQKHVWYGVGMKADVFEFEGVDVVKRMDGEESDEQIKLGMEKVDWELFGRRKGLDTEEEVGKALAQRGFAGPVKHTPAMAADGPAVRQERLGPSA